MQEHKDSLEADAKIVIYVNRLVSEWKEVETKGYAEIPKRIDPLVQGVDPSFLSVVSTVIWGKQREWTELHKDQSHNNPYTGLGMYLSVRSG